MLVVVEPRIAGVKARRIVKTLGFDNFFIEDPIGYAGGVWLCWDSQLVSLDIVSSSSQFIHSIVKQPGQRDSQERWSLVY